MSNLKFLKKTVKEINKNVNENNHLNKNKSEKSIYNILFDNIYSYDIVEKNDSKDFEILVRSSNSKSKITTNEVSSNGLFNNEYELVIRKNTLDTINHISGMDYAIIDSKGENAFIKSIKRNNKTIELICTKIEQDKDKINMIESETKIYTFSKLNELGTNRNYRVEPIEVIFGELHTSKKLAEIEPDYKDLFVTKFVKDENKKVLKNITSSTIDGETCDSDAYSLYSPKESAVAAYKDYRDGELRPATLDVKLRKHK